MEEQEEQVPQTPEDFFKSQIYQQNLNSNMGWNTIMQAMVGKVSEAIVDSDRDTPIDMEAVAKLMELSKNMQMDTISIMKAMKD